MLVAIIILCAAAGLSLFVKQILMKQFAGNTQIKIPKNTKRIDNATAYRGLHYSGEYSPARKRESLTASFKKLAVLLERIAPVDGEGIVTLQTKLDRCGLRMSTNTWRGLCILIIFLSALIFFYMGINSKATAIALVIFAILGGTCGKIAMELYLVYREKQYSDSVENALPDTLDILSIAVSSGLTLEDGFIEAANGLNPKSALGHEFSRMNWEVNFCNIPRTKALEGFMDRVDCPSVSDFCTSTIQAIESGGSLARNLTIQAQTARDIKFDKTREKIAKLDTKMTIPLGLFFMPATGILILAPVLFNAFSQGLALLGS